MSIKKYKNKENETRYEVRIRVKDGRGKWHEKRKRAFETIRKAQQWEIKFQKGLACGAVDLTRLTFAEWHKEFLEDLKLHFKNSTVKNYDGNITKWIPPEWNGRRLSSFSKLDIHHLLFERLEGLATPHKKVVLRKALHRIFQAAIDEGVIVRNPVNGIKVQAPQGKKLVLSPKEAKTLLEKAKECNHEFYEIWYIALFTGMRSGEMYALEWKDVNLLSGFISVNKQWTSKDGVHQTKTNKVRVVPINEPLRKVLESLRAKGPFKDNLRSSLRGAKDYFTEDLVLPRSRAWKNGEQSKVLKDFCRMIGITPLKFHDLRATFITSMLVNGASTPKVMAIVGHSRMSTTDVYLRLAGVGLERATDILNYS